MAKSIKLTSKCPPGTFCIETYALFFSLVLVGILLYLIYQHYSPHEQRISIGNAYTHHHNNLPPHMHSNHQSHMFNNPITLGAFKHSGYDMLRPIMDPSISFNQEPKDTLMNPYSPPLQYNQPHSYKQVGYLKNENHTTKMLPIFAKPIHTRRDKWYYYTIYDNIKLPIYSNGRKCSSEHGCDSLMSGDNINLENVNDTFAVYLYDNHTLTYDPSI